MALSRNEASASFGAPVRIAYAARECIGEIPFGSGPNELERRVGYVEVDGPEGLTLAPDGWLWIRHSGSGKVHRVEPKSQKVQVVDITTPARAIWSRGDIVPLALARCTKTIAVLGARVADDRLDYALLRFSPVGSCSGAMRLPELGRYRNLPHAISCDQEGRIAVQLPSGCHLFAPDGASIAWIDAPSVLLPEGLLVSSDTPPWLHDAEGRPIGRLRGLEPAPGFRFCLAGPRGLLFAFGSVGELPVEAAARLVVLDVYQLDAKTRRITLEDRLIWPQTRFAEPAGGVADALPIESEFLAMSLACDVEGNLHVMEHAPPFCRFHRFRLLRADESAALAKRPVAPDSTPEERALHQAEHEARAELRDRDMRYDPFFRRCRWYSERVRVQ